MRLPSYCVTEYRHGRTYGSISARLKYASKGNPARGPGVRDEQRHPLDGHERGDHSKGLRKPAMGTMDDRRGRYATYTARLVDTVLTQPGHTPPELRRAIVARAAGGPSFPLSGTERGTGGEDLAAYVDKVARHAYQVTDEDLGRLQQAGHSDDALFEVTVSAALGAALGRLERGLAALRGTSSPPVPLSALGPHPLTPSPFGRGGTQD